jgi:hypothetical protein
MQLGKKIQKLWPARTTRESDAEFAMSTILATIAETHQGKTTSKAGAKLLFFKHTNAFEKLSFSV